MNVKKTYANLTKLEVSFTGGCIFGLLMRDGTIPEGFCLNEVETNEEGTVMTLYCSKAEPASASAEPK